MRIPDIRVAIWAALLPVGIGGCHSLPASDESFDAAEGDDGEGGAEGEGEGEGEGEPGNTNVNFGGAQDFGFVRGLLEDGIVPRAEDMIAAGFFAEHHTALPDPTCGNRLCAHAMLGVMGNLMDGAGCTLLQIGLNSPLTVDPDNKPPLSIALVVDVSGSMAGENKIGFVRDGLTRLINELDDDDKVAIIAYASNADLRFALADVAGNRNELLTVIDALEPTSSTNIFDGLELGYGELLSAFDLERDQRVILVSDGVATAGNTAADAILAMSSGYNREGVGLTTIGVGTDFDPSLMVGLAEQADGNSYFVEDAVAVEEVFMEELSYFAVAVGYDVDIDVQVGEEYALGAVYGTSLFVSDGARHGSISVPSVFLAGRTAADDTTPGGGRRGGGSALLLELTPMTLDGGLTGEVATVSLSFKIPGTEDAIDATSDVVYPLSPTVLRTEGYFENRIVEKSFVMMNLFVGMQSAANAFWADQDNEAIAVVDDLIAAAADYEDSANAGAGDADILADIELLELFRTVLVENGAPPEDTETGDDPWPAD